MQKGLHSLWIFSFEAVNLRIFLDLLAVLFRRGLLCKIGKENFHQEIFFRTSLYEVR